MIRSRFKIRYVFWFIATLCLFVTIVWVVTVVAIRKCATGFVRGDIILLFPCLIGAALLLVLKGFRYITIDKGKRLLKSYSIFALLGRKVLLCNCIGVIVGSEGGIWANYKVAFLINDQHKGFLKLNGLFYKDFDELVAATELIEIKRYRFSITTMIMQIIGFRFDIK